MPTTFNVFFLGTGPSIDVTEGDNIAQNATALNGLTFGSASDPLVDHIQSFSPGSPGYLGGDSTRYDMNNAAGNETFRINGGANQTFDGLAIYRATVTYTDGTTATISAVVAQDTTGKLYLVPENAFNADQVALEAKPVQSLRLNSVESNNTGLVANRAAGNYAVCFAAGTAIRTPQGARLIDDLKVGDLVTTLDNGPQPVLWIGRKHLDGPTLRVSPDLRPILIRKGVLGAVRDLLVSPQHGLLVGSDHLVRAKHLAARSGSGVRIAQGRTSVTYMHLMFAAHQVVFSEGVPSESFYPGPMAQRMVDRAALKELRVLLPEVCTRAANTETVAAIYGGPARPFIARKSAVHRFGQTECAEA